MDGAPERRLRVRPRSRDGVDGDFAEGLDLPISGHHRSQAWFVEVGMGYARFVSGCGCVDVGFDLNPGPIPSVANRSECPKEGRTGLEKARDRVKSARDRLRCSMEERVRGERGHGFQSRLKTHDLEPGTRQDARVAAASGPDFENARAKARPDELE